ncbi:hypothetical protein F6X40_34585 [Paraburkholderia sp. UCT31]|uniref:hypothetical protein n=1 Tax=Paraburkholderia sp. UCT31 TaxID=2615209 RepID=UPI001655C1B0|nr:hypothetical protein [Paraburkholderia sp. UCT31]MBC8741691.1 hypothetical protein [Paraburkholderia sp. UCT31]
MRKNVHLLLIDPQNDFCHPDGSLVVPGAYADMERLCALHARAGMAIDAIHVTVDSHSPLHISSPMMWENDDGKSPEPFTAIRMGDVVDGRWRTRRPDQQMRAFAYLKALESRGRGPHVVLPEHCIAGSWGANVYEPLQHHLEIWARRHLTRVNFVQKGMNCFTDYVSALEAQVPDPLDPSTSLNKALLHALAPADIVLVAGEATSHGVAATMRQTIANLPPTYARKFVLLTDCMSAMAGFAAQGEAFIEEMKALGVQTAASESVELHHAAENA